MKKAVLLIFALSLALGLQAQKEQKILVTSNYTADRSSAKKYRDGQPLKDVEVRINDMTTYVKTDKRGIASISLLKSANQYRITSIEKKNYELAGAKNIYNNMQLYQAEEPLRLIMVSTADKDKVVSRLRKEIDSLRTENKRLLVAKERTDSTFFKVEEYIERLEASIFDRALEYLGRDLSLLDSANLEAQLHIMEGNYEAAEQALPNIYELIAKYKKMKELYANAVQVEYNTFETYITAFTATLQFDSAAHYAMMRADRYENDIQAQIDAGLSLNMIGTNLDLAIQYFKKALLLAEHKQDSLMTGNILNWLAEANQNKGNIAVALSYCKKAVNINEAIWNKQDTCLAETYYNIASVYDERGNIDSASHFYKKALTIFENNERNQYLIPCLEALYLMYLNVEKDDSALAVLNRVIKNKNLVSRLNREELAYIYGAIGHVYSLNGKSNKASTFVNKALIIMRDTIAKTTNKIELSSFYTTTASLFSTIGETDSALFYHRKNMEIWQSMPFMQNSPDLAMAYNNIASLYQTIDQQDSALSYIDKCWKIYNIIYDKNSPELAQIFAQKGDLYSYFEDYKSALNYYAMSLSIYISITDETNPNLGDASANVGIAYYNLGENEKALSFLNKALEIHKICYNKNSLVLMQDFAQISLIYLELGDTVKANKYWKKAEEIERKLKQFDIE